MSTTIISGVRRLPESDTERMAAMERQIADLKAQLLVVTAERDDLRNEVTALHVTEDNLRAGTDDLTEALVKFLRALLDPAINENGEWYRQTRAEARDAIKRAEAA